MVLGLVPLLVPIGREWDEECSTHLVPDTATVDLTVTVHVYTGILSNASIVTVDTKKLIGKAINVLF